MSRKTKIRIIYKSVIRPATYACETWILKKVNVGQMGKRDTKRNLRRTNIEEGWRRKRIVGTNKEL